MIAITARNLVKNGQEQDNEIIGRFVMRVRVIQNKCGSVGMCVKTCPDIFRFQEGSKKATVIVDKVPPHLEQKCFKAAGSCPNKAVAVFFE